MKNLKKVLVGVVICFSLFGMTAFGLSIAKIFTDQGEFPDWASTSIFDMYRAGVINGYEENGHRSFKPEKPVTRAELAVMLDRFQDNMFEEMGEVLMSYDELEGITFDYQWDNSGPKVSVAMAMAGLRPIDSNDPDFPAANDLSKIEKEGFPTYDVYEFSTLPAGIFYVNYHVEDRVVPESGGETVDIDQWYGPFEPAVYYLN